MSTNVESAHKTDDIIKNLASRRIDFIQDLLHRTLTTYLEEHFNTIALSAVKSEFLKRDLKQLVEAPLDLVHYSLVIRKVKESGNEPDNAMVDDFIRAEVRTVIIKYVS